MGQSCSNEGATQTSNTSSNGKSGGTAKPAAKTTGEMKIKLTYFDGLGRGESIRYILAASGHKYEDKRLPFPADEEWINMKPKTPWGSVPLLEVNGKEIGGSIAICRFVAKMAGFAGSDNLEQALIESVADCITDIREGTFGQAFAPEDQKEEVKKEFVTEKLPKMLEAVTQFQEANGGTFLVGSKMTWADLHFAAIMDSVNKMLPDAGWEENFPKLVDICRNVRESPKVAEYLANRKETAF